MKSGKPRVVAALLAVAVLVAGLTVAPATAGAANNSSASAILKQIQAQQENLRQMQAQMARTQHQLDAARVQVRALQSKVAGLRKKVAYQQQYVNGVEAQLKAAEVKLKQTQADLAAAQKALAAQQQLVDLRVKAMYEDGTVDYLGVLLSARSFSDLIERFVFLKDIYASDVAIFHRFTQLRDQAAQKADQANQQQAHLVTLQASAADALGAYRQSLAEAKLAAGQAQAVQQHFQTDVEAEAAASAQVTQMLSQLRVRYQRAKGGFALIWPIYGPIRITSPFGMRFHPILHIWELHTGIDIAASTGTPIHAAESGRVVLVRYLRGDGNSVVIDHGVYKGHAMATLYAHMSRFASHVGEVVHQGQVIGYVGMTGWATGPHLHFEVHVDGKVVNPIKWLPPIP